jgi:transposase
MKFIRNSKLLWGLFSFVSTIKKWTDEFKRDRTTLQDYLHKGRPKSATIPEIIEQENDMLLDDRRMKVREIADTIGVSKERVGHVYFI